MNEDIKPLVMESLVRELRKSPDVKKISMLPSDDDSVDLVITILKTDNPGKLHESARLAMEQLKSDKGPECDLPRVRMGILAAETNAYLGHMDVSGPNSTPQPVEGFHFDPADRRVLYRNPPKQPKEKKKKIERFDPEWAKAKKLCRLNQQEIRMAKELGMGPRSLMRNIPSPKQKWKLPVNLWIREKYEKRHPGKGFKPEPPLEPIPRLSPWEEELARRQFEEEMYWEDYRDRNDIGLPKGRKKNAAKECPTPATPVKSAALIVPSLPGQVFFDDELTQEDLPF